MVFLLAFEAERDVLTKCLDTDSLQKFLYNALLPKDFDGDNTGVTIKFVCYSWSGRAKSAATQSRLAKNVPMRNFDGTGFYTIPRSYEFSAVLNHDAMLAAKSDSEVAQIVGNEICQAAEFSLTARPKFDLNYFKDEVRKAIAQYLSDRS